jgi:hypothetical protein
VSPGITVSVHLWRGIGPDTQRDLFVCRLRLGFLTLAIERNDTLVAYRVLRATIDERIKADQAYVKRSRSQDEIDRWEEGR